MIRIYKGKGEKLIYKQEFSSKEEADQKSESDRKLVHSSSGATADPYHGVITFYNNGFNVSTLHHEIWHFLARNLREYYKAINHPEARGVSNSETDPHSIWNFARKADEPNEVPDHGEQIDPITKKEIGNKNKEDFAISAERFIESPLIFYRKYPNRARIIARFIRNWAFKERSITTRHGQRFGVTATGDVYQYWPSEDPKKTERLADTAGYVVNSLGRDWLIGGVTPSRGSFTLFSPKGIAITISNNIWKNVNRNVTDTLRLTNEIRGYISSSRGGGASLWEVDFSDGLNKVRMTLVRQARVSLPIVLDVTDSNWKKVLYRKIESIEWAPAPP